MDLYIACPLSPVVRLVASPCETIFSVKLRLQLARGLPASSQRLVWRSQELVNERRLHDYSIESGCTLQLLPRLLSGPASLRLPVSALELAQLGSQHQQHEQQHLHFLNHANAVLQNACCYVYYYYLTPGYHTEAQALRTSDNADNRSVQVELTASPNQSDRVCVTSVPSVDTDANFDAAIADQLSQTSGTRVNVTPPIVGEENCDRSRDRCHACHRRMGPSGNFLCRCGQAYCARHRYPESHNCRHDFKAQGRSLLADSMPRILASKIQRI